MSIWRIAGGIGITLLGLSMAGIFSAAGSVVIGIILIVAGIALIFGK